LDQQQVMQLQQALQERGLEPGSIDGMMGPQTRQALEKFQRDNNLEATGALDERTAQELGLEFTAQSSSESSKAMGQEQGESSQTSPEGGESAPSS
jgi:peptidoglycan hydrolase-like protein with peptidoglycan-binding domain